MRQGVLVFLLFAGCAVGGATSSGAVWGVALGQARVQKCTLPPGATEEDAQCTTIAGGALSPEGGRALGVVGRLLQLLAGVL